eukprot:RCo028403
MRVLKVAKRVFLVVGSIGGAGAGYAYLSIERTHRLVEYKVYNEPDNEALVKNVRWYWVGFRFVHLCVWYIPLILAYVVCVRWQASYRLWCRALKRWLELTGPAFVKLGQWIAIRSDIFPKDFCDIMSELHDQVTPHSMRYTRKLIREQLGKPLEEVFDDFQTTPVGSGSIAQVYFAKLKGTSQEVAVKVTHPDVREKIALDFFCIQLMAKLADPLARWMDYPGIAKQFARNLSLQVDLRFEADNLDTFNRNFADSKYISFPKPVPGMAAELVLVEEKVDGEPIHKWYSGRPEEIAKNPSLVTPAHRHLAKKGADLFLQMIITDNFFHADIHPGNVLVCRHPEDPMPYLVLLDVGVTQCLTRHQRDTSHQLMASIVLKDWPRMADALLSMSGTQNFCDVERFTTDIIKHGEAMLPVHHPKTFEEYVYHYGRRFGLIAHAKKKTGFATDFVQGIFNLVQKHRVKIDPPFASLLFSCLLMEKVANQIDPTMDVVMYCAPWFVSNAFKAPKRYAV